MAWKLVNFLAFLPLSWRGEEQLLEFNYQIRFDNGDKMRQEAQNVFLSIFSVNITTLQKFSEFRLFFLLLLLSHNFEDQNYQDSNFSIYSTFLQITV